MKKLLFVIIGLVILGSCQKKADQKEEKSNEANEEALLNGESPAKIAIYYFHGDRRCKTCKAVGAVSESCLKDNFSKEMTNNSVEFVELNYDEANYDELMEKFEASGSSLCIKTEKDNVISYEDLTDDAFMYAVKDPEKLRKIIIEKVTASI